MRTWSHTARGYSRGARQGRGTKRIAIQLPDEMFEEIARRAHTNKVSFAEQVRTYVEWGLEVENQDGK